MFALLRLVCCDTFDVWKLVRLGVAKRIWVNDSENSIVRSTGVCFSQVHVRF